MNWFQWVEWLLPIPDGRGSNLVICKNLYCTLTVNCIEKTKVKKKRSGMAHLKNVMKHNPIVCSNNYQFQIKSFVQSDLSSV